MCTVIEIIPFKNTKEKKLLLKEHKFNNTEVIGNSVVVYKIVRYSYDDRI